MTEIRIAPNIPLTVALVDPEGVFDFETGIGRYQTTAGEILSLPRPAVIALNQADPRPGEPITICKHWSGRTGEKSEWTVELSPAAENARAAAEAAGKEPPAGPGTAETTREPGKSPVGPPIPIRRPARSRPPAENQPSLFDRGTGTYGPRPRRQPAPAGGPIPANVAVREILAFVNADPNTENWSAEARQDLASTILIASFKAGYIGLWERDQWK